MAPTGDQPRPVQSGQVFGHGAGGELVPPGQGLGGGWLGERLQQGGPGLAKQARERLGVTRGGLVATVRRCPWQRR
jgi:hypothetical protein